MAVHFHQSSPFEAARVEIEQHLFDSVLEIQQDEQAAIKSVDQFAQAIEHLFDVLEQMYQTPRPNDAIGEKSFPIREGRYRVFFKVVPKDTGDFEFFHARHRRQQAIESRPLPHT